MWTVVVQFGGGEGTTECGLLRYRLWRRLDDGMWTGEVQFRRGERTTECGLARYRLGAERVQLNVDW